MPVEVCPVCRGRGFMVRRCRAEESYTCMVCAGLGRVMQQTVDEMAAAQAAIAETNKETCDEHERQRDAAPSR